jgi:PAS domain S-box-containing protein
MGEEPQRLASGIGLDVFDAAPVGVLVSRGPEHRLAYLNAVYRGIFGDRPLGHPLREVFPDLAQTGYFDIFDRVLATGRAERLSTAPVDVAYPGSAAGRTRYFDFSVSRAALGAGEHGVVAVVVEVTEQVESAERIRVLAEQRRRALLRYRSLVSAGSQIVWVTGPRGGVIEPSPAWERVTGQTWEQFRGEGWLDAVHPDDRQATARAWQRALADVPSDFTCVYRLRTADGHYRHFAIYAAPVHDGDTLVEWVGTCADIEQEWQAGRREELLARAAGATADTTGLEEMLDALSHVLVPDVADTCCLYLLPQTLERPPGAALTAERLVAVTRPGLPGLAPHHEEHLRPGTPLARAVERGRPVLFVFPPGEPPRDLAAAETAPWLPERANSVVLFPVVADGTTVALLVVATSGDRPPLDRPDIDLLRELAERVHAPLHNAFEFQRTRHTALALQRSLLTSPPDVPGVDIAVRYRPSAVGAEVGGDWYDVFALRDGATVLTVGDVAGHDLSATVAMGQTRNMLRGLALDREDPTSAILHRLDQSVQVLRPDTTATCILARLEQRASGRFRLQYSVAGHPPPLLVGPDGTARFLSGARGPLLGVLPDPGYTSAREPLPPGSTLLLYTDGLVERRDEDIGTGLERLRGRAAEAARRPLEVFCDDVLAGMLPAGGDDDVAMLAVRVTTGR